LFGEKQLELFLILFMPTLDVFTDLAYILSTKFMKAYVFYLSIFFFFANSFIFLIEVFVYMPSCSMHKPTYTHSLWIDLQNYFEYMLSYIWNSIRVGHERVMPYVEWIPIDNLGGLIIKLLLNIVIEIVCIIIFITSLFVAMVPSGITGMAILIECGLRWCFVVLWLDVGIILHTTKLICLGKVWR
jgi:hypothetical protein